jgi:hypothetical protein
MLAERSASHSHSMRRPLDPTSLDPHTLRAVVRKHLPAWFRACAAPGDIIVMHERSFGTSAGELFLLGCALKYAGSSGKTVHVTAGEKPVASRFKARPISIEAIYREEVPSPPRRPAQKFQHGRGRRST